MLKDRATRRAFFQCLCEKRRFVWREVKRQATKKAPMAPFFALKRSLFAAWNAETLVEAVNAATGSHFTLLTSVERVTFATNVQVQIVTHS
jgi:hypothetical protein